MTAKKVGRKPLPKGEKRIPVCIKLKPETAKKLRDIAAERGVSQAAVIEDCLSVLILNRGFYSITDLCKAFKVPDPLEIVINEK